LQWWELNGTHKCTVYADAEVFGKSINVIHKITDALLVNSREVGI